MQTKYAQTFFLIGSVLTLHGSAPAQPSPPTPAQMAQHQVERYTQELSLDTSQQTQALAIFTEEATSAQTLQQSAHTLHTTLNTAITTANSSAISQTAASLGTIEGQLTTLRASAEAKLYLLLTSDQQTKFVAFENGPHGPGSGGPGGPPPPLQ